MTVCLHICVCVHIYVNISAYVETFIKHIFPCHVSHTSDDLIVIIFGQLYC